MSLLNIAATNATLGVLGGLPLMAAGSDPQLFAAGQTFIQTPPPGLSNYLQLPEHGFYLPDHNLWQNGSLKYFCATAHFSYGNVANGAAPPGSVGGNSPMAPAGTIKALPRGGAILMTSEGWVQFGVPMWTNKDSLALYQEASDREIRPEDIPFIVPTKYIFDLDYVDATDGLIPADFVQYMHFVTQGMTMQLVAPDAATAQRLEQYLNLSYRGPDRDHMAALVKAEYSPTAVGIPDLAAEMRSFDGVEPEALRQISAFSEKNIVRLGGLIISRRGRQQYTVHDGRNTYQLDLGDPKRFPLMRHRSDHRALKPNVMLVSLLNKLMDAGRPALVPIGTGHGFCHDEETSGFMLWNQGRAVIIDPPSSTLKFLSEHDMPLETIAGIILTHGHSDHYGNAIPQLLQALPDITVYTTPVIYDMLRELYNLAVGSELADLAQWDFVPLYPQQRASILGMSIEVDYSFHSIPTIGFDLFAHADDKNPMVYFSGDTNADHQAVRQYTLPATGHDPIMTEARAARIIRHVGGILDPEWKSPIVLIDNGVPPLHTPPQRTRELLDQAQQQAITTQGRVFSYHIAAADAEQYNLPKWQAGPAGYIDLSVYYPELISPSSVRVDKEDA